ncbi:MAG: hypothetical protein Q4D02_04750 [Clostridia bacterium]|nr:hypothetical protein [Clostridia bacterium]
MKIKKYNGENKLTRKNIISVAKAFYDGLSYDKEFAPAGWDFEPGARLVNLKSNLWLNPDTGLMKTSPFEDEDWEDEELEEMTQFDRWMMKHSEIYHEAIRQMKELKLKWLDITFLPSTLDGSVEYSDCCTHWKPTINAFDEENQRFVFEENRKRWYMLKIEQEEYDVPCGICDWGTALGMGAFVRFLEGLIG